MEWNLAIWKTLFKFKYHRFCSSSFSHNVGRHHPAAATNLYYFETAYSVLALRNSKYRWPVKVLSQKYGLIILICIISAQTFNFSEYLVSNFSVFCYLISSVFRKVSYMARCLEFSPNFDIWYFDLRYSSYWIKQTPPFKALFYFHIQSL